MTLTTQPAPSTSGRVTRRRWLAGTAAATGSLFAAACGAGATAPAASKSAAPVTITYTDWEPTDGAQIQETVIGAFKTKYPHITVDYQKNVSAGYLEKIQTLIVAGTVPDTFALGQAELIQLTAQNSVADLDAYVKRDAKDVNFADFFKPHAEAWRVGGELMGLARDGGGVVTFYNKSLLDAQNIKPPTTGYTWDEWLDVARRLAVRDGPSGQVFGAVRNGPADWLHWVWQNGGDILDKDAKRATLEAPEAIEALQYHADLVQRHAVMAPLDAYGPGNQDAIGLFMQGKAAMYFGLRSGMQRMRAITGFQLEVMPHPRRKNRMTPLNTTGVILPRAGKNNDAAWYLLQHMTSTEGQLKRMEQGGAVPSRDSVSKAPSYLSFRTPAMASDRINTIFPEMAREGSVRLRPQTPKWSEVLTLANQDILTLYSSQASAGEVAKRLSPRINELLR